MTLLPMIVASAMAAVLLFAALEKIRGPAALAETMRSVGMPRRVAPAASWLVVSVELSVAAALLFRPDSLLTKLAVLLLAALFALAGAVALRIGDPIPCNCFGASGGRLGVTQIIALVPWSGGAAILHFAAPRPAVTTAAAFFAAIALGMAAFRAMDLRNAVNEARGDRRSAEEMYEWLPSY